MPTHAIDHVNVLTDDLDASTAFYRDVLELTVGAHPAAAMGFKGAWMVDSGGKALVHLVWNDPAMTYGAGREPGASTNAVHHIAFDCTGFAEAQARLAALGLDHQINDGILGLRQIMVKDPNAITVEMNFHEQ